MEGFWPVLRVLLPARAWLLAAPMHTPPARTQSHHPRWSSSGSPATSCPSFPQRVAPCLGPVVSGAPPFRCAPGSLHTSSADNREEERILESYRQNLSLVSLFSYSIPALFAWDFFFIYIVTKVLAFTYFLLAPDSFLPRITLTKDLLQIPLPFAFNPTVFSLISKTNPEKSTDDCLERKTGRKRHDIITSFKLLGHN